MRRIVMMIGISLDGFFEGPNREIDWHLVDDELHTHMNEVIGSMSAILHGRMTYELMAGFWPTADSDPSSTKPMVEFARIWLDMPKVVYSRTLERADWNTTIVREVDPEAVMELKARPGGDMALGGPDLAAAFIRRDLVDEFRIYVHPVLIGRGNRPFGASETKVDLRLLETRTFGNGVVLLHYERR
jgi:dihydrofolate reductase